MERVETTAQAGTNGSVTGESANGPTHTANGTSSTVGGASTVEGAGAGSPKVDLVGLLTDSRVTIAIDGYVIGNMQQRKRFAKLIQTTVSIMRGFD